MSEKTLTGYPSIDKPWLKYYTESDLKNVPPKTTVFENIYQRNRHYPDDIALIYYGKKFSYKTLFQEIEKAEAAFLNAGVKSGDNVAFLMLSCPEMLFALLALNRIGACANMVNPTFTPEQMRDRINETGANLMLILDQLYPRLKPVLPDICATKNIIISLESSMPLPVKLVAHRKLKQDIPEDRDTISWKRFTHAQNGEVTRNDYTYKEGMPALMVYSSGTTGASKGIVLTNEGINGTIQHYDKEEYTFQRGDAFLHMGAPWLSTLMVVCLLMPLQKGITVIIEPVFSEDTFYKDIKKYKPEFTLSTISHWLYVMNHKKASEIDFSNMKYPITGGEKVLPSTETAINEYLHRQGCPSKIMTGYGMCELGSTATSNTRVYARLGAVGYPITGVTVAAFDMETNSEKRYGERGEIRVLTPNRMKEYYQRTDATSEFFWKDSSGNVWGCTGDVGYVDEDGFVFVQGRATDTYRLPDGKLHYCFDIEDIILNLDGIDQCEIVAVPNETGYDDLHCFVVKESGVQDADLLSRLRE